MWTLIENDAHRVQTFPSRKALRDYAQGQGLAIKRSPTSAHCFYTEAVGYVPGEL